MHSNQSKNLSKRFGCNAPNTATIPCVFNSSSVSNHAQSLEVFAHVLDGVLGRLNELRNEGEERLEVLLCSNVLFVEEGGSLVDSSSSFRDDVAKEFHRVGRKVLACQFVLFTANFVDLKWIVIRQEIRSAVQFNLISLPQCLRTTRLVRECSSPWWIRNVMLGLWSIFRPMSECRTNP